MHPHVAEPSIVTLTAIRTAAQEHSASCATELADLQPGSPISRDLALHLIRCGDDDLPALLAAARAARDNFKPGVVTYSRKVFLPLDQSLSRLLAATALSAATRRTGAHTMIPEEC